MIVTLLRLSHSPTWYTKEIAIFNYSRDDSRLIKGVKVVICIPTVLNYHIIKEMHSRDIVVLADCALLQVVSVSFLIDLLSSQLKIPNFVC